MHRFEIQLSDSLQRFLESQAADYGFGALAISFMRFWRMSIDVI